MKNKLKHQKNANRSIKKICPICKKKRKSKFHKCSGKSKEQKNRENSI